MRYVLLIALAVFAGSLSAQVVVRSAGAGGLGLSGTTAANDVVCVNASGAIKACDTGAFYYNTYLLLPTGSTKGIRFGDGDTGLFENSDDSIYFHAVGVDRWYASGTYLASLYNLGFSIQVGFGADAAFPTYSFLNSITSGMYAIATNNIGFSIGGNKFLELGGSQTSLCFNTTAATGVTGCHVQAGAGQGSAAMQEWRNNAGTALTAVPADGGLDVTSGTVSFADSANVASAATVALPAGNLFHITGTTTIVTLNTCDATNNGRLVSLIFDGILTFTDGSNLKLAGDFVTTADDSIQLVCDGTNWYETSRSVN